jgi:hypothetical protein
MFTKGFSWVYEAEARIPDNFLRGFLTVYSQRLHGFLTVSSWPVDDFHSLLTVLQGFFTLASGPFGKFPYSRRNSFLKKIKIKNDFFLLVLGPCGWS